MPKIIELTVELAIQRVSCPGVWLCQDGRVSLTVFALGTSYQTCLLPPAFPLMFKDVFYFKKRFEETCALNNICCLLKNETIYCELVQWCEDCSSEDCMLLAQYLGSLCDVLFPPNVCSTEGVDLLMRRSKNFPGILSPKIEIATKVRIDEVWNRGSNICPSIVKLTTCHCSPRDDYNRQKQVCHSARYHRVKCQSRLTSKGRSHSCSRSRSRSRSLSDTKGSSCSLNQKPTADDNCCCPNPLPPLCQAGPGLEKSRLSHCRDYCVYNVQTDYPRQNRAPWIKPECEYSNENEATRFNEDLDDERMRKIVLESRYIDTEQNQCHKDMERPKKYYRCKVTPCVCEICKRYHQLFHVNI